MNLLELNKKIKEKELNKQKVNKEVEDYKEIREVIYEISIGNEKHETNNKKLFDEIGINLKKQQTYMYPPLYLRKQQYEFKLNETNISKIQKYIDKEKQNEQ